MFDLSQLERAHEIVGQAVPPTPAHAWPLLSERLGTSVVVKHENHTPIGAFKVRGGLVYMERLKREPITTSNPSSALACSVNNSSMGVERSASVNRIQSPVAARTP